MNRARREEAVRVLDKEIKRQGAAIADEKKRENVVANLTSIRQAVANGEDSFKCVPYGSDAFGDYLFNEVFESLKAAELTVDAGDPGWATILDDRFDEDDF